jgi:hypothetical protein
MEIALRDPGSNRNSNDGPIRSFIAFIQGSLPRRPNDSFTANVSSSPKPGIG